jgi:hypothetical protein
MISPLNMSDGSEMANTYIGYVPTEPIPGSKVKYLALRAFTLA